MTHSLHNKSASKMLRLLDKMAQTYYHDYYYFS